MRNARFEIQINAPVEKVWDTMLGADTYTQWTGAFHEGSYYEGSWGKGSMISFVDPSGGGLTGRVTENLPHEFVSIEYVGVMKDGQLETTSDMAKMFIGAHEKYTFRDVDGGTHLTVEIDGRDDLDIDLQAMFDEMWPKALAKLKELCEA